MKICYVNIICGRNVCHNNSIFPTILYLQMEWLKIAPIRIAFRANMSTSVIHRSYNGDPLGQVATRYSVATGDHVTGRLAGLENQALYQDIVHYYFVTVSGCFTLNTVNNHGTEKLERIKKEIHRISHYPVEIVVGFVNSH